MTALPNPIPVDDDTLDAVAAGAFYSPHSVLGAHVGDGGITIRAVAHLADAVEVVTPQRSFPAVHERGGVWVAVVPGDQVPAYRLRVTYGQDTNTVDDPYHYLPTLGETDTYPLPACRPENLWPARGPPVRHFDPATARPDGRAVPARAPEPPAPRGRGPRRGWAAAWPGQVPTRCWSWASPPSGWWAVTWFGAYVGPAPSEGRAQADA